MQKYLFFADLLGPNLIQGILSAKLKEEETISIRRILRGANVDQKNLKFTFVNLKR